MKIEVGNKVKFINENLEGKILEILAGNKILVACSDGFDHEVSLNEVVVLDAINQHNYNVDEAKIIEKIASKPTAPNTNKGVLAAYMNSTKYKLERVLEIDLHLEVLVEFPGKLEDWQKLHKQMQHVKNCLAAAMDSKHQKLVFIHGVGTGVLKTELKNYLSNYTNISYKDADFREYGMGATEVLIKD